MTTGAPAPAARVPTPRPKPGAASPSSSSSPKPPETAPAAALNPRAGVGPSYHVSRTPTPTGPAPSRSRGGARSSGPSSSSTGPLSDRATAFLIRRVLCPQQQQLDKGRSTPAPIEDLLPPLTSRNDVDLQLYALIAIILREFVQNWYSKITTDEVFVAEIVQLIAHCTRALEQRLRKVDLESLLFDEIPDLLERHIRARRAAAQNSIAQPPLRTNPREVYHSLCPLRALSPIPRQDSPGTIEEQARNEAAYRQLLVQGVLAILLPTEDLENKCLVALVGQLLSDLIIGDIVANRLSEPWLIWEGLIILSRVVRERTNAAAPGRPPTHPDGAGVVVPRPSGRVDSFSSLKRLFWSFMQWCFVATSFIRLLVLTIASSRSLPPRRPAGSHKTGQFEDVTRRKTEEEPTNTTAANLLETHSGPVKVPVLAFRIFPAVSTLIEMDVRMPWLCGAFSLAHWMAMTGPGRIADVDGTLDRILSHSLIHDRLLNPANLPPLLRGVRAALFPNNAPGKSSLRAPSNDAELASLRRRCASALWALVPRQLGRLYFGSSGVSGGAATTTSPQGALGSWWRSTSPGSDGRIGVAPPGSASSSSHPGEVRGEEGQGEEEPTTSSSAASSIQRSGPAERRRAAPSANLTNSSCDGNSGDDPGLANNGGSASASASGARPSRGLAGQSPVGGQGLEQGGDEKDGDNDDDQRILAEIESGIVDVFGDAYCNKHLIYSILELVLVRLMPELAEKGVIELWEERLS